MGELPHAAVGTRDGRYPRGVRTPTRLRAWVAGVALLLVASVHAGCGTAVPPIGPAPAGDAAPAVQPVDSLPRSPMASVAGSDGPSIVPVPGPPPPPPATASAGAATVPVPRFRGSAGPVPDEVAARSTWHAGCPVALDDLAYLTVTIRGFDGRPQAGELIVHEDVAGDILSVFESLFDAGFPIEELRVTSMEDLARRPREKANVSESYVCRPVTGGSGWSQHAYGLAIDLNPFQNPYVRGEVVLPPGSDAFLDRTLLRPGMITDGDEVVGAFASIGWGWGGHWDSLSDWQHFSRSGT